MPQIKAWTEVLNNIIIFVSNKLLCNMYLDQKYCGTKNPFFNFPVSCNSPWTTQNGNLMKYVISLHLTLLYLLFQTIVRFIHDNVASQLQPYQLASFRTRRYADGFLCNGDIVPTKHSFTKDNVVYFIFDNASRTIFIKQQHYYRGGWIIIVIIIAISNI